MIISCVSCGGEVSSLTLGECLDYLKNPKGFTASCESCLRGSELYYCPTSGDMESPVHGGFDTCCDRPDLHQPVTSGS